MPVAAPDALAWTYDNRAGVNRYRHPDTGRFVGAEQIRTLRDDFLTARSANARDLASKLAAGDLSLPEWETAMREQIKLTHGVEYAFGRGGLDQMTPKDWETLGTLVAGQFGYLNSFAGEIADGTLSEAGVGARSELYVSSAVGAYERGAASAEDVELPVYPGDDCEGMANCRCSWDISTADDGSIEATWIAEPNACEVCADHADEYSPLVIEPGEAG